ncbi:hypothetical protein GAW91_003387 [Vibrio fluvialis]|nr:hypothetical protein [Vibrio fluvialis]
MKYIMLIFFYIVFYSDSSFAGIFCACNEGTVRQDKQPVPCSGKCPANCQMVRDPTQDDFLEVGCNSNQSRIKICNYERCIEEIRLTETGYADGHKNWWCRSVGYDGKKVNNSGIEVCYRKCSSDSDVLDSKGCLKKPMACLGYSSGNRGDFCKDKGFDDAFNYKASIDFLDKLNKGDAQVMEPGYCYTGDAKKCIWEVPSSKEGTQSFEGLENRKGIRAVDPRF